GTHVRRNRRSPRWVPLSSVAFLAFLRGLPPWDSPPSATVRMTTPTNHCSAVARMTKPPNPLRGEARGVGAPNAVGLCTRSVSSLRPRKGPNGCLQPLRRSTLGDYSIEPTWPLPPCDAACRPVRSLEPPLIGDSSRSRPHASHPVDADRQLMKITK